jgi:hypothetical protein
MRAPVHTYEEPMNESELSFLREKEGKERRMFIRTVRTLAVMFVIVPCCLGIIMESLKRRDDTPQMTLMREEQDPHVYLYYFFGMLFLLLLVAVGSYISYARTLKQLMKDIRRGYKTIEQTVIYRKAFVESNNTYHFFLRSPFKLSIEVSGEDYGHYDEGDEINIEYSTFSRNYFGYF